ncbi:MAG TPA: class I SAM-dependent methyltransferase [Candidatus Dormibacteraeota bacterium]|nr:class I SAM-dependent methyltransferase [Candidatus Dormibacteraeota bacterium]
MIDRLLRNATVYDLVQQATGARISEARIRDLLRPEEVNGVILDVGGGTGIMARLFAGADYCCMDLDIDRVRVARSRGSAALVGDAARIPVIGGSIDLVIQRAVSHHLTDSQFEALATESCRVLKPDGRLMFLDATWEPRRIRSRLLWAIDQGSHPRTEDHMRAVLARSFHIETSTTYAVFHRYFLAVGRPRADRSQVGEVDHSERVRG